jgi:hypothetical protein
MKIKIILLIACIFALILLASCQSIDDTVSNNQKRADPVIIALEAYNRAYRVFPNDVYELVPKFINEIPKTTTGDDFFYSTNSVDGYVISFIARPGFGCGYTYQSQEWECGYGD